MSDAPGSDGPMGAGELWQLPATGRWVRYHGAAFFTARAGQLTSAWVLGDLDAVKRQLEP